MIDTYYAPVYQKEINQEEDGEFLFATKRKPVVSPVIALDPDIARLPRMAALSPTADVEMSRKMDTVGQVGLGWLR